MSWRKLLSFVLCLVAVTLLVLVLMTILPQDKYLRYQALNDGQAPTAYWIYERINRDPTPIDVAFIGTSRTAFSIHSARLQDDLATLGVQANVANLHVVKTGRNMQYVIAKELLTHKSVRLLVLEMDDEEPRTLHPDFIYLADNSDVVLAPLFINFRYFSDLARLPGRQVGLFTDTELERLHWAAPTFIPPTYEGPHLDHAEFIQTLDGVKHYRNEPHTKEVMDSLREHEDTSLTPRVLPKSLNWLEYRVPRYYINQILSLAAEKGTRVVFLYLPRYGAPKECAPCAQVHDTRATVINPWEKVQDYRLWDDAIHLNWDGAKLVTDYVASQISEKHLLDAGSEGVAAGEPSR